MNTWLTKNHLWLVIGALLCADVYFSLIWDLPGRLIYFDAAVNLLTPSLQFYMSGAILFLATSLIWRFSDWRWGVRVGIVVLFLLPLPIAFLRGKLRAGLGPVTDRTVCAEHMYIDQINFPGELYHTIYECDRQGFLCQPTDIHFSPPRCPDQ